MEIHFSAIIYKRMKTSEGFNMNIKKILILSLNLLFLSNAIGFDEVPKKALCGPSRDNLTAFFVCCKDMGKQGQWYSTRPDSYRCEGLYYPSKACDFYTLGVNNNRGDTLSVYLQQQRIPNPFCYIQ